MQKNDFLKLLVSELGFSGNESIGYATRIKGNRICLSDRFLNWTYEREGSVGLKELFWRIKDSMRSGSDINI